MYYLTGYSNDYAETSEIQQQSRKNDPNHNMKDSELVKYKSKLTHNTNNASTVNVNIALP